LLDPSPDFFMRGKLPFVELLQAFCHLLAVGENVLPVLASAVKDLVCFFLDTFV
jgi:hypothetical protein